MFFVFKCNKKCLHLVSVALIFNPKIEPLFEHVILPVLFGLFLHKQYSVPPSD